MSVTTEQRQEIEAALRAGGIRQTELAARYETYPSAIHDIWTSMPEGRAGQRYKAFQEPPATERTEDEVCTEDVEYRSQYDIGSGDEHVACYITPLLGRVMSEQPEIIAGEVRKFVKALCHRVSVEAKEPWGQANPVGLEAEVWKELNEPAVEVPPEQELVAGEAEEKKE